MQPRQTVSPLRDATPVIQYFSGLKQVVEAKERPVSPPQTLSFKDELNALIERSVEIFYEEKQRLEREKLTQAEQQKLNELANTLEAMAGEGPTNKTSAALCSQRHDLKGARWKKIISLAAMVAGMLSMAAGVAMLSVFSVAFLPSAAVMGVGAASVFAGAYGFFTQSKEKAHTQPSVMARKIGVAGA